MANWWDSDPVSDQGLNDLIAGDQAAPQGRSELWGTFPEAMDFLTMGGSTKLNAAGGALIGATVDAARGNGFDWSKQYDQQLAQQRADQEAYNTQHPYRSAVGKGAGLALGITNMPVIADGLKGALLTGAAYGGAGGGLQDASSIKDRIYNTLMGAGAGTAIGGVGYGAGKLASAGLTKASQIIQALGASPEDKAAMKIYDAAQGAGVPALQQRLADLGPDGMVADVLGERGKALGRFASNVNPDARETLETAVLGRKAGQNQRLVADLESASGLPAGSTKTVDALIKDAETKARPAINKAYDAARVAGADVPLDLFSSVLGTKQGEAALEEAVDDVGARWSMQGDKAGGNLAIIDKTKQVLDSKATAAYRAGDNASGSLYSDMAKNLRAQMDALLQGNEYKDARALAQASYKGENAYRLGQELAAPRIAMDLPAKAARVDPVYAQNVAQAYAAQQSENLLNRGATEGTLGQLSTPLGKKAYEAALGPKAANIEKALGREKVFNATAKALTGNSTTARQLAEMAGTGVGTSALSYFMGLDPMSAGVTGLLAAGGRKLAPTLANKLVTEGQRAQAPFLAELLTKGTIPGTRPIQAGVLENLAKADKDKLIKAMLLSVIDAQKNRPQMKLDK